MELTYFSDYAMRVLIYLGVRSGRLCQISQIAKTYGISRNHLVKVVHGLARAGFINSYRGRAGGITLARKPEEIRLGDVLRYTEGSFQPVECFRPENQCVITPACFLPAILNEAFRSFMAVLDRYTLADLLVKQNRLDSLFDSAGSGRRSRGAGRKAAAPAALPR
jgi:Rrf2 family nitric oxide-sensitive transcriptional repressor